MRSKKSSKNETFLRAEAEKAFDLALLTGQSKEEIADRLYLWKFGNLRALESWYERYVMNKSKL